jgi:mono/diheme cytochrome c family protein
MFPRRARTGARSSRHLGRNLADPGCLIACLLAAALLAGCEQHMADQPSLAPLEESESFPDGSAQYPPPNTLPREAELDETLTTGLVEGELATELPMDVTPEVLARGEERYGIFCLPCHGPTGAGDGLVVQHGFPEPPPLTIERLRDAPVGRLFQVITAGIGPMPPYGPMIPPRDRGAITAYLRALQEETAASADPVEVGE